MNGFLFCLNNLLILWIALRWSAHLSSRTLDFVVGLVALFPICGILTVLAGGLSAHLNSAWIEATLLGAALLVTALTAARSYIFRRLGCDMLALPATRITMALFIAFASFPLVRVITAGTGYFIDDFGYHTVAVASWVKNGDFRQFMPQFMSYLPLNAELLSCWFALPYHMDGMVVLAGVVWLGVATAAAAGLVRQNGGSLHVSILTATLVMVSPPIAWQLRTFSACDLAGSACLLAAIYFIAPLNEEHRIGRAVAAGLLAGFAAGTKATFLPVSAVICLYPLFTTRSWRERWQAAGFSSLTAASLGSIWYFRNALATGNPLFPAQFGPLAGPLTALEQSQIKLVGLLATVPWTARLWGNMLFRYLDWPFPFGLLAVAGYVRAFICECRPRAASPLENSGLRRLLFVAGLIQFVLHSLAPYCSGGGYIDGQIEVYSRYVMPWFLFGIVLAAPLLDSSSGLGRVSLALAGIGMAMCWPRRGLMMLGGVAVLLICLALFRYFPSGRWKLAIVAGVVSVWPIFAAFEPKMRVATRLSLLHYVTTDGRPMGDGLLALEALPPGTRIARYANHSYLNSPLFGRDWQFEPVFTDNAGVPLQPLHLQFRADPSLTLYHRPPVPMPAARQLISNLRAARITAVFVTKFDSTDWPPQQALFEESEEATALFRDDTSTLWSIR